MNKVSLIVPCRNEREYIESFLQSIALQDYPQRFTEIIIVDGQSDDGTYKYLKNINKLNFFVLENSDIYVSHALNKAISMATGSFILRLDIHCKYPKNYISSLVNYIQDKPHVGNVGAMCNTLPADNSIVSRAIALSLSSRIGVGLSSFRIGNVNDVVKVDTVPFGCWRRELFNDIGLFDIDLIRNQDDELNQRIIKHGLEIHLLPYISVDYFGRSNFLSLIKMFYQYGLFKPLVNKKIGKITTYRQLAPVLLIFIIVSNLFFYLYDSYASTLIFFFLALIYLLVPIFFIRRINSGNLILYPAFVASLISMHLSYGLGYMKGLIFGVRKNKFISSR